MLETKFKELEDEISKKESELSLLIRFRTVLEKLRNENRETDIDYLLKVFEKSPLTNQIKWAILKELGQ